MATSEERIRVLKMVEEGKLSPDEAAKLLAALTESAKAQAVPPRTEQPRGNTAGFTTEMRGGGRAKRLRIKVTDNRGGKNKNIDVDLPVGAVRVLNTVLKRFGANTTIAEGAQGISSQHVVDMVDRGVTGRIFDVRGDEGERIEISLE